MRGQSRRDDKFQATVGETVVLKLVGFHDGRFLRAVEETLLATFGTCYSQRPRMPFSWDCGGSNARFSHQCQLRSNFKRGGENLTMLMAPRG